MAGINIDTAEVYLRAGRRTGEFAIKGGLIGGAAGLLLAIVSSRQVGASGEDSGAFVAAGIAGGGISGIIVGSIFGATQVKWVPLVVSSGRAR